MLGFIAQDGGGPDVFVRYSEIQGTGTSASRAVRMPKSGPASVSPLISPTVAKRLPHNPRHERVDVGYETQLLAGATLRAQRPPVAGAARQKIEKHPSG
ncbi:hypothetical protein [Kutzneria buriramensis]|uniref:hypothetical protein n=1 Tax=Kutzneria buriramensis TaxID=1045776 RepID=UPI001FEA11AF|nr:hypothetical protein [Kutzneria buriramensis]